MSNNTFVNSMKITNFIAIIIITTFFSCTQEETLIAPIEEEVVFVEKSSAYENVSVLEELTAFLPSGEELELKTDKLEHDEEALTSFYHEKFIEATNLEITLEDFSSFAEEIQGVSYEEMTAFIESNEQYSPFEKEINLDIITAAQNEDYELLYNIYHAISEHLSQGDLGDLEKIRLQAQKDVFDAAFAMYPQGSEIFLQKKGAKQIVASAVVGGLGGMLTGTIKGCITGTVLGWNPGTAAGGCLGGMIIGLIGGTVGGAIEGAVVCAIFN